MDANRLEDLHRLYSLLSRVSAQATLRTAFCEYIKVSVLGYIRTLYSLVLCVCVCQKSGSAIVQDEERDSTMVTDLLDFKERLDTIIAEAFGQNEEFLYGLKVYHLLYQLCI